LKHYHYKKPYNLKIHHTWKWYGNKSVEALVSTTPKQGRPKNKASRTAL